MQLFTLWHIFNLIDSIKRPSHNCIKFWFKSKILVLINLAHEKDIKIFCKYIFFVINKRKRKFVKLNKDNCLDLILLINKNILNSFNWISRLLRFVFMFNINFSRLEWLVIQFHSMVDVVRANNSAVSAFSRIFSVLPKPPVSCIFMTWTWCCLKRRKSGRHMNQRNKAKKKVQERGGKEKQKLHLKLKWNIKARKSMKRSGRFQIHEANSWWSGIFY